MPCSCGSDAPINLIYACSGVAHTGELIEAVAERVANRILA
jgi:uncharacterized metal-binding protein